MMFQNRMNAGVMGVAVMGVLFGAALLLFPVTFLMKAIFVIVGVLTVLGSLPGLLIGYAARSTAVGAFSFVSSLISLLMGFFMMFNVSAVLLIVVGAYMILLPLCNLIIGKGRGWRRELPRMILGAVLILLGPERTLATMLRVAGWVVLGLTAVLIAISLLSALRRVPRAKRAERTTGNRVFVDVDGDGDVDSVYVDTTGDGKPDTERRYRGSK